MELCKLQQYGVLLDSILFKFKIPLILRSDIIIVKYKYCNYFGFVFTLISSGLLVSLWK